MRTEPSWDERLGRAWWRLSAGKRGAATPPMSYRALFWGGLGLTLLLLVNITGLVILIDVAGLSPATLVPPVFGADFVLAWLFFRLLLARQRRWLAWMRQGEHQKIVSEAASATPAPFGGRTGWESLALIAAYDALQNRPRAQATLAEMGSADRWGGPVRQELERWRKRFEDPPA